MQNHIQAKYAGRDWASLARDYAARALTVDQLSALYAVSRTALYNRARREGWRMRIAIAGGPVRRHGRRADFGRRLIDALDRRIADFEARNAATDGASLNAADAERDARTLNTLVRLYDKLQGAADKVSSASKAPASTEAISDAAQGAKDTDDPDGLRRDLARRLEKLRLGECR